MFFFPIFFQKSTEYTRAQDLAMILCHRIGRSRTDQWNILWQIEFEPHPVPRAFLWLPRNFHIETISK